MKLDEVDGTKRDDGRPEKERGKLLGPAVVSVRPSHRHHLEQHACQPSVPSSSPASAADTILRPVFRRPRPALCPSLVAALALVSSTPLSAQEVHTDKLQHAGASAGIVDVVWLAAALLDQPLPVRLGASVVVAAAAGLGKEGLDLAGYGTPDVADLVFDGLGIGLGVAVALVVEALHNELEAPATEGR